MTIRDQLVQMILKWEYLFGFFPGQAGITAAISEYDAAIKILKHSETEYKASIAGRVAVSRGYDFIFNNKRIQVKANRPGRHRGATVWNAGKKVKTDGWDTLIYILYDEDYEIQEAYQFDSETYERKFSDRTSLRLEDMREGENLTMKLNRENDEMDDSTQSIICRAISSPSSVKEKGRYTNPQSYGVYKLPANCGATRRYRFGNHPVRRRELNREYKTCECKLMYLFLSREDAKALASMLNDHNTL